MDRYVTRFAIVALGAIVLSASTFVLMETHKYKVARDTASQESIFRSILKIEHEVEFWTQHEADCVCTDRTEAHEEDDRAQEESEKTPCYQPSPAERMGMAVRSVSL